MSNRSATKPLSGNLIASLALLAWSAGGAQAAVARESLPADMVRLEVPGQAAAADQQLQAKVENALLSDPYFYGAHVTVSVKNGTVFLEGFVFSDWDLRDAIRIATKAAGGGRVVDNLTIEVGGRK